jgi:hypothetical protein
MPYAAMDGWLRAHRGPATLDRVYGVRLGGIAMPGSVVICRRLWTPGSISDRGVHQGGQFDTYPRAGHVA